MAKWQRTNKEANRREAAHAAGVDPKQPAVFTGQTRLPRHLADKLMKAIAAPLGSSADTEIVDPTTGKFYYQDGISQPGGTDVPR